MVVVGQLMNTDRRVIGGQVVKQIIGAKSKSALLKDLEAFL